MAYGVLALILLAVAAWFRIAGTTRNPFWLDEGYSAYAAAKGFHFLWHVVPLYETHPPFYYSLLRLWTLLFGDSLVASRALGISCGLLTLPIAALAGREAARWFRPDSSPLPSMLAAFALAALSPPLVDMAREVRPYPVLILTYVTALFALLRLGRVAAGARRIARGAFLLYLLTLALMLWLHNLGVLYGAALGLALLTLVLRRDLTKRDWLWLVGGHLAVAILYLPALLILLDQAPTWIRSTWLHFDVSRLPERLLFLWAVPGALAVAAGFLALCGAIALLRRRDGWRVLATLLLLAVLPVVLSILISLIEAPVFIVRTMTPVAVPLLLLFAIGATLSGSLRLPALLALLLVGGEMARFDHRIATAPPMQDWYGTVAWLQRHYRAGDEIWSYPNEGALPLDYAMRDKGVAFVDRAIPTPVPTLDGGPGAWNPTGSRGVFSLPAERLYAIAQSPAARAVPTIWLHRLGANAYDKGDVLLHTLSHGRVVVARWQSGPIDIIGLRRRDLVDGSISRGAP